MEVNTKYDIGQVIKFKGMTLTIRSIDVRVHNDGTASVWSYYVDVVYKGITSYKTLNTEEMDSIIKANEALQCTLSFVEDMYRLYRQSNRMTEMSSYELTFTERPQTDRNLKTGRFIKGMTPHNKGKKWSEWMDGRKQKRVKKQALANLDKGRRTKGRPYGGRPKKKVIAVTDEGDFFMFLHANEAVKWSGGCPHNIRRCCRENLRTTLTKGGKVNDEHKYLGFRWYFEGDHKWINKIKKQ